jgi:Trp operon repressor
MTDNLPAVMEPIDGEIIEPEPLDKRKAQALDKKSKAASAKVDTNFHALIDLLEDAAKGQIHVALGYATLASYVKDAVRFSVIERIERKSLVALMSDEGMSQRAIADAFGVGVGTVNRDLAGVPDGTANGKVKGNDGKEYPARKNQADPEASPADQVSDKSAPEPKIRPLTTIFAEDVGELDASVRTFVDMAEKNMADERFPKSHRRIADQHVETLERCISDLEAIVLKLTDE